MNGGSRKKAEGDFLTVITVSYNSATTIVKTIESLRDQSDQQFEYIIIDGGSTDGTLDIIKEYDEEINFWLSESDKGMYDAMNKGINYARGNYIAFINSDDVYLPNTVSEVLKAFKENDTDLVYGNIQKMREINGTLYFRKEKPNLQLMPETMGVFHPATFAKKSVYLKIGNFDLQYKLAADYDWMLRAYLNSFKWYYLDMILAGFLIGGVSNMSCLSYKEAVQIQEFHKTGHSENMNALYLLCQKKMRRQQIIAKFVKLPIIKSLYTNYLISKWSA